MSTKICGGALRCVLSLGLSVCLMLAWGQAQEDGVQEKILAAFHPYRRGPLRAEGITAGMRIDASNFQVAHEVLPPEVLKYLQSGDFAITVQETTDAPLRQAYIKATLENHGKAQLGDGEFQSYVSGLPFPLIDPLDPQAGLQAAWNNRYRDWSETFQAWPTNDLRTSSGAVERSERSYAVSMYGMHRPEPSQNQEGWEKEGILAKRYIRTLAPSDVEGNQGLSVLYDKDTLTNDQWAYDPKTRRTRKVVDNPYEASRGGELLNEDRGGFGGYIHAYEWKYLGDQVALVPGFLQAAEPTLGGRGNWYPLDPWELRRVIVVEAKPKGSHPVYSRRVLYIDLQTYVVLYVLAYDHAGNHKRTFLMVYLHPAFNPGNNEVWTPQVAAQLAIDYQRERASIFQTHKVVQNKPLSAHRFSIMGLMLSGK